MCDWWCFLPTDTRLLRCNFSSYIPLNAATTTRQAEKGRRAFDMLPVCDDDDDVEWEGRWGGCWETEVTLYLIKFPIPKPLLKFFGCFNKCEGDVDWRGSLRIELAVNNLLRFKRCCLHWLAFFSMNRDRGGEKSVDALREPGWRWMNESNGEGM